MFLLVLAVPALLVVVVGYVVGHGSWTWLGGLLDAAVGTTTASGAEAVGWVTGVLALIGVARVALVVRRTRSPDEPGG